jgi:hypothetical protein
LFIDLGTATGIDVMSQDEADNKFGNDGLLLRMENYLGFA